MITSRRHIASIAGSIVIVLLMLSTLTAFAQIPPAVKNVLQIVNRESDINWDKTGILWLTGDPKNYRLDMCEKLKDWARSGRVVWMDISVVPLFGMADISSGGTKIAVPAPGSKGHPLLGGIKEVQCMDTWYYLKNLPKDAVPILVADNRTQRTVVAIWPLGKGFILFRPETRPVNLVWQSSTKRRWIVPDLVDGEVFLQNIYNISLASLAEAGFISPQAGCKEMMGRGGCPMMAEGGCPMKAEGGCPMMAEGGCPMMAEGGCPMKAKGGCPMMAEGCCPMMTEGGCPMKAEGGCPMCKKMKHKTAKPAADAMRGLREAFDAVLPASSY